MKYEKEVFLTNLLREMEGSFPFSSFMDLLESIQANVTPQEAKQYLQDSPLVFRLDADIYTTRCGVFAGANFAIKPSKWEIDNGVLLLGTRVVPFLESEIIPAYITVIYKGKRLKNKVVNVQKSFALDLYQLVGYEYAPQFIAADPANDEYSISEKGFILPQQVKLTGFSLSPLIKEGFKYGDRLNCKVKDWQESIIQVQPVFQSKQNPFVETAEKQDMKKWYNTLEKALLDTFEHYGPTDSIDYQLSLAFLNYSADLMKNCSNPGSIYEYLENSKKVGFESFGIETRLWYKGHNVPVVGAWSKSLKKTKKNNNGTAVVPDAVMANYILDMLFQKKDNVEDLLEDVIYSRTQVPKTYLDSVIQKLKIHEKILKKDYNWFADQDKGPARHKALNLYSKTTSLIYDIDAYPNDMADFPQQQLAVLYQISKHLLVMLHSLLFKSQEQEEIQDILTTLDGMNFHFNELKGDIQQVIKRHNYDAFEVMN